MGCGLSTPMIAEDGSAAPQAAPGSDESGGSRNPHKRSKSQVSSKELGEMDPLMGEEEGVPGRKSVSGRLESVEDGERRVEMDMKKVVKEDVKEESGETAVMVAEKKEEERDGSEIGPGSPSFREYCLRPTVNSVNLDDFTSSKSFEPKKDEKHRRRHSIATTEGSNAMFLKKEHKSGRFKRVIPKGGQAAVKNLLSVTGCYCTNPHSHHHIAPTTSA